MKFIILMKSNGKVTAYAETEGIKIKNGNIVNLEEKLITASNLRVIENACKKNIKEKNKKNIKKKNFKFKN